MLYLRQMKDSIFNFQAYKTFVQQSFKKVIFYLLAFTLILGTIDAVRNAISFNTFAKRVFPVMDKIVLHHAGGHSFDVIYNTPLVIKDMGNYLLLYNPELIEAIQNRLSEPKAAAADSPENKGRLVPLISHITFLFAIISLIFFFIGKLVSSLFLCIIGILLSNIQRIHLSSKDLYSLSIYALTLPGIIQVLKNYTLPGFPYFNLLYYTLAGFYLWKAIQAIKTDKTPIIPSNNQPIPS
ncbi:MAG: DUF1189 family protein [Bacillota bacterium]